MTQNRKRIAFPTSDQITIDSHFGHCRHFMLMDIADGAVIAEDVIDAPPHTPGALPKFLAERDVNVIVSGGMGQKAVSLFEENSIEVVMGADGKIVDNLEHYIAQNLQSKGSPCNHEHSDCDH